MVFAIKSRMWLAPSRSIRNTSDSRPDTNSSRHSRTSRSANDSTQRSGGFWFATNARVVLQVTDLPSRIEALKRIGLHFRNEMEVGPGGKQIQLEDPDGNPIVLFEPAR